MPSKAEFGLQGGDIFPGWCTHCHLRMSRHGLIESMNGDIVLSKSHHQYWIPLSISSRSQQQYVLLEKEALSVGVTSTEWRD